MGSMGMEGFEIGEYCLVNERDRCVPQGAGVGGKGNEEVFMKEQSRGPITKSVVEDEACCE